MAAFFPQTALCLNRLATEGLTDFAALEAALLAALKHDGARGLEELLHDPALPCPNPQPRADEENFGPRPKGVLLTLGWITLRRTCFYSAQRQEGRFALDAALGWVDRYSPGVARWMCRAAAWAGSYQAASQDLLTYASLDIDARQIQRMATQMAPRMTQWQAAQAPVFNPAAGDIFCVGTDGTGAPMRRKELRGRKGKNGRARTREVKVGTVFTHRKPDQPCNGVARALAICSPCFALYSAAGSKVFGSTTATRLPAWPSPPNEPFQSQTSLSCTHFESVASSVLDCRLIFSF